MVGLSLVENCETSPRPSPLFLRVGSVRARSRHSLPRRLARAAAALQSRFPFSSSSPLRIPQASGRAARLFRSGALETHIARSLGSTVGLNGITTTAKQIFFSAGKDSSRGGQDEGSPPLQVSGKHLLGPSTVCETIIQGTKVSLLQLQLKMVHTLISPLQNDQGRSKPAGRIAFITASDLQSRHRLTMESTFGNENGKHSLSAVVSSDLRSRLSWGLASSLNVNEKLIIFSRYNNDAHAGQRVVFQAVSKVDERNTVSPILSTTLGSFTQGGLTWTHSFSQRGNETIQVKAFCSSNGSYMVSVKAQLGEVEC